ncbi:MAG TPA: aspartyl/asparaginyl beta-hydroxylase domain-containing protein [Steroidobacteraceae bacterium]|jgi:aspartate beta-hydroxylase|nr:aspartyl/asparaginyl beta-hydroxylase domain-containing protein [Steroidobacteraceae bacterium]
MSGNAQALEQARQLLRQGRFSEAERFFATVLESEPDHVEALNVMGLAAIRTGDLPGAVQKLERVVTLVPDEHAARLYLALALERSGDRHRAILQYARALNDAQLRGRWLDASSTPPALRPLVERAVAAVRAGRRATFMRVLEPLAQRYGRSELARVEQCLRIYLQEEEPVITDARQQPTFLFFPGLGAAPYLDRSLFDWIPALEADTEAIRAELLRLLPESAGRERVFDSEALEQVHLRGLDVPPSWTGYYFYRHGVRRQDNCASCPATARALDRLPLVHVRDHGPEVLFSVFTPGTHLLPHRGVTNTRLVGHLPLIVPENCALNVGGEIHEWQPGRVVVFDDTYEHEAWNRSRQTRVVMIFDVWHPRLTEVERLAVTDLVGAIGDFRKAMEAA